MPIVSTLAFTKRDIMGNHWTEGWYTVEFQDAGYLGGGEAFDFTRHFKRIEAIMVTPISGAHNNRVQPNQADFPGNASGLRLQAFNLASAVVVASGVGISLVSGTLLSLASNISMTNGGWTTSGNAFLTGGIVSGRIAAQLNLNAGVGFTEVLSNTALSGQRALLHIIGY